MYRENKIFWISDRNDFSYFFYLQVTRVLPAKFRVNWPFSLGEEAKNRFTWWSWRHLGFPIGTILAIFSLQKRLRENVQGVPQSQTVPFPDPKRKRKQTKPNKRKSNKRTKSTKISSLFPKRGNRNAKRTENTRTKMTQSKTLNKSPRRMDHKATKSKTNTGITALERSVEQTTGGFKALLQPANFTMGPDTTLSHN